MWFRFETAELQTATECTDSSSWFEAVVVVDSDYAVVVVAVVVVVGQQLQQRPRIVSDKQLRRAGRMPFVVLSLLS